jgi:hypothetical protein
MIGIRRDRGKKSRLARRGGSDFPLFIGTAPPARWMMDSNTARGYLPPVEEKMKVSVKVVKGGEGDPA